MNRAPAAVAARSTARRALTWLAFGVLGVGAALLAPRAQAMTALDDAALSQVTGQASQDLSNQKAPPGMNTMFSLLSAQGVKTTQLTADQFRAVMAERGVTLPAEIYNGGPVSQAQVDGAPISTSFELGHFLAGNFGVDYHGPSMGTISINNLDARGTTIWVWFH